MKKVLNERGIIHQTSVPYYPEQNSRAEREFRTIIEAARSMLAAKNLPKRFWAKAVGLAVYILNRTGTSGIPGKTPFKLWEGQDFDVKNLIAPFGTPVWAHIPQEKRKKLDVKSKRGLFMGYGENRKGFRVYFSYKNVVTLERNIVAAPEENLTEEQKLDLMFFWTKSHWKMKMELCGQKSK